MRQVRGIMRSRYGMWLTAMVLAGLTFGITACGSSSSSSSTSSANTAAPAASSTTAGAAATGSSDPVVAGALTTSVSAAALQNTLNSVFVPGFKASTLPVWQQTAFKVTSQPLTASQQAFVNSCIKNTTCSRSTGKYTIGFADGFGGNGWRKQSRVALAAALARYPEVKKFIYTDGMGMLPTMISNIHSLIAQKVNVLMGSFDGGDAELPAIRQAAAAGIPVIAYTQSPPSAKYNGTDVTFAVKGNECSTGTQWGKDAVAAGPGQTVAMYTGSAGNPYAALWEPCAKKAIAAGGGKVVFSGNTDWTPQGEAQAASALLAKGLPDVVLYDYSETSFMQKFAAAGKFPKVLDGGTQDMGAYAEYLKVKPKFHFTLIGNTTQNGFQPVEAYLGMAKLLGKVPAGVSGNVAMPIVTYPIGKVASQYLPVAGSGAAFGSGLPNNLIIAAQKAS